MAVKRKRKRTTKRKLSPAQRAALAKGRRALRTSRKRKTKRRRRRSMSGVVVLPEGTSMARKRKRRRRPAAAYGGRKRRSYRRRRYSGGVPVAGRRRRRRRRYYGGAFKAKGIMAPVIDGAMVVGGAVGGSFIAGALPLPAQFAKVKPFIPLAGGVLLTTLKATRNNPMLRMMAIGMITASGLSLIRQFAPQVPLMTGEVEDELLGITDDELELLGLDDDELELLGLGQDDEDELLGVPMLGVPEDMMGGGAYMLPSDL